MNHMYHRPYTIKTRSVLGLQGTRLFGSLDSLLLRAPGVTTSPKSTEETHYNEAMIEAQIPTFFIGIEALMKRWVEVMVYAGKRSTDDDAYLWQAQIVTWKKQVTDTKVWIRFGLSDGRGWDVVYSFEQHPHIQSYLGMDRSPNLRLGRWESRHATVRLLD